MRRMLVWLTVLGLVSPVAAVARPGTEGGPDAPLVPAAPPEVLPLPDSLEARVRFWIRVYSEVGTEGGLLHDPQDLGIVYDVVRHPGTRGRTRERAVERDKKRYARILRRLASGKRSGLSRDEARVLALFPDGVSNGTLARAARRVRFQLGQADKFRAGVARSGRWEDYIRGVLHNRGVPEQLAALPHVESSFNPAAHSHAGASGIWQFTRSTGRRYLRVDHVIDERRDPLQATVAAARLLRANYETTGTWPLAITAYNHGAAGMRRAVSRLGTRDIGEIVEKYNSRTFGFASRNFYAEFLAALQVSMNHVDYFGPIRKDPPVQPEIVVLDAHYAPATLAAAFGVPLQALREANRALLAPVWEGQKYVPAGYALRVPRDPNRPAGEVVLASIDGSERFSRQKRDRHYRVHRGDTLSRIARRFGVRQAELVSLNGLRSRHRIRVGQLLRLPLGDQPRVRSTTIARERPPANGRYTVRRGDSLWVIARRFGVSPSQLARANDLHNRNRIHAGQVLVVPGSGVAAAPAPAGPAFEYRVQSGDNLSKIASLHHVSVREIMAANGMRNGNHLRVGQRLRIPGEEPAPAPTVVAALPAAAGEPAVQALAEAEPETTDEASEEITQAAVEELAEEALEELTEEPAEEISEEIADEAEPESDQATRPVGSTPLRLDLDRYAVSRDGTIRVEPEETLGHYADWLDIPTQWLRNKNHFRSDRSITLGRRVKLDFSRVSREDFSQRRIAYHQGLVDSFFLQHRVAGTEEYVLERGDTLWLLSHRKLSVPVWLLAAYNPEVDFATPLKVGQRIRVPRLEQVGS